MNIGLVLPGFSADEGDWALPVQVNLVRTLTQRDTVRVLALRYPHRQDSYTAFGATVMALGAGQARGRARLALWRDALRTIKQMHTETPFDVLHGMWADETGLLTVWAGRRLGVQSVVSILGGELTRLHDIDYGLQRGLFSRWIVGQALRADAVVMAGAYARERIRAARYRVPDSRLHIIPMGVDTRLFRPDATPRDPRRLVHVGSLVPVKDQATLLRALARLEGVTLDIIGDGTERTRLAALAESLGIAGRVHFLGAVPHTDLPLFYRRATLHVMTSRSEALPLAALEAAACGTPTICTAAGALPNYPAIALTVPVGDDAALAQAISDLLDNPQQLSVRRAAALDAVRHRLTIYHTAAKLRDLYATLAATTRPYTPAT
jgi:glycosyltransferase involved in cell wall biosynthesis